MKRLLVLLLSLGFLTTTSSCVSFGTVSKAYNYTKQQIWEAATAVINKNYSGVKRIEQDEPPTLVSNLSVKDKKFGIDKSAIQVLCSLSGFIRPYVVDVDVRIYPTGEETGGYSKDRVLAQEVQEKISQYLQNKKYNSSLQDTYKPY